MADSYVVTATGLNLRSTPAVSASNKLVTLPQGEIVRKIGVAADPAWWQVSANLKGAAFEGYVKSQYLAAADASPQPVSPPKNIPAVHLKTKTPIRRDQTNGRAYPLNEQGQPRRTDLSAGSLTAIIDWLDVEEHVRYLPVPGVTYCNIYAYDYCYLGNGFLPRVWWTNGALDLIAGGKTVEPLYDKTVRELNANSLHDWLDDSGPGFGWRRVADVESLQNAANAERLAIICARRKDLNRSGHICAVVPETSTDQAVRSGGVVRIPLQSQAGATNFRYGGKQWWTSDKFSAFGFWIMQ